MHSALILCSGGLDSVVLSNYIKKSLKYQKISILFFNYGQRNIREERISSKKCAKEIGAIFKEIDLKFINLFSTSLLNKKFMPKKLSLKDLKSTKKESEKWYVPSRNFIFLSIAISYAESLNIKNKEKISIFIGFKNEGNDSYPDASEGFIKKINEYSNEFVKGNPKVLAPLIKMDKEDIINLGRKLDVKFRETYSCYNGGKDHCGFCLSCKLRQEGFYWANTKDPTKYKIKSKDFRIAIN